jgi:hypothetical protein
MKTFKVNKNIKIICRPFRTGFGHIATLYINEVNKGESRIRYYNRTWESFEYESVLEKLADENQALSRSQKITVKKYIKNGARIEEDLKPLKNIAMIAALGDIFGSTQKESNDWKTRMLKAGLENRGLIMPDNWNQLSEADKQARLDGAISTLK